MLGTEGAKDFMVSILAIALVLGGGMYFFGDRPTSFVAGREAVAGGKELPPIGAEMTKSQGYNSGIWRFEFSDGVRCIVVQAKSVHCDWPPAK